MAQFKGSAATFEKKNPFVNRMKIFADDAETMFVEASGDLKGQVSPDNGQFTQVSDDVSISVLKQSANKNRGKAREIKKTQLRPGRDMEKALYQSRREEIKQRFSDERAKVSSEKFIESGEAKSSTGAFTEEEKQQIFSEIKEKEKNKLKALKTEEKGSRSNRFRGNRWAIEQAKASASKKQIRKERAKAGAKTAFAGVFQAKKDLQNDLADGEATGDALADGNRGLLKTMSRAVDPRRWAKRGANEALKKAGKAFLKLMVKLFTWLFGLLSSIFAAILPVLLPVLIFLGTIILVLVISTMGFAGVAYGFGFQNSSSDSSSGEVTGLPAPGSNTWSEKFKHLSQTDINSLTSSSTGTDIQKWVIGYALSKVGCLYNQDYHARTDLDIFDCSSLAYRSWLAAGVDISYGKGSAPSAATEAKNLADHNLTFTDASQLQPGDLVFFSSRESNGRYMNIYHVSIYIGNGMVVSAQGTDYGVRYGPLKEPKSESKSICLFAHPGG